ncbi:hypothetical protein DMO59_16970 [Salmonella enterica subsp. diarizonae]|nr:hypothetical protein [Salmonella enterica subsp. diarizonae]
MIAAIDLYQFARTRTPVTWLRDPCGVSYRRTLLLSLYNVSAHNVYYVKYAGFVVKFMRTSLSGTYRRISRLLKFSCGFTITS